MAYYNDGKTFRNLPEQVDKNKTDIEEMQSTVETDEKNINDNMNKILAHDTRINALETTKLSATDNSIKLTRSNAEMGSVSIAKVGGNTLVNGNDIPLATINGESIMQNKDFTIDSNLSNLLWANLGIGRWANQTFVKLWYQDWNFNDSLLPYYTNFTKTFYGVKMSSSSSNDILVEQDFNNAIHWNALFYTFAETECRGNLKLSNFAGTSSRLQHTFFHSQFDSIDFKDGVTPWKPKPIISWAFANCPNLVSVGAFDCSNVTNFDVPFKNSPNLKHIGFTHIQVSLDIANSNSNAFETADLVEIISNLDPVSTTQTLTMGATNLAKLSSSDILIATGKGWQLA